MSPLRASLPSSCPPSSDSGMHFEFNVRDTGEPSTSGRTFISERAGSLLLSSSRTQRIRKKGGLSVKKPLTLGGLACLAKAALKQTSRNAQLNAVGKTTRKAVLSLPESGRRLLAGAVAGKVRGRLLAAAWAGAVSKTATAPLETIRMQMMTGHGTFGHVVRSTWAEGGVRGFFSGNSADVLRTMPSKAIELASFDLYKNLLSPQGQQAGLGGIASSIAGGLAGVTSTVILFPLETARTRMACNRRQYKSVANCLGSLASSHGLRAWYQGLDASLIGVIPYAAVRLGMYDGLKWAHTRVTGSSSIPAQNSMLYGALAAVTSATVSFPLEVVRRRMMMGTARGGTLAALTSIAQTEGVASLYKGVALTWLKQAPQYAVTFCCYDLAKAWLATDKERDPPPAPPPTPKPAP